MLLYHLYQLLGAHEPWHTKTTDLRVDVVILVEQLVVLDNPAEARAHVHDPLMLQGARVSSLALFLCKPRKYLLEIVFDALQGCVEFGVSCLRARWFHLKPVCVVTVNNEGKEEPLELHIAYSTNRST